MRVRPWIAVLVVLTMLTAGVQAASSLSIRLVEASNAGSGASPGLNDVAAILKGSLAFSNYKLIGASSINLPATGAKSRLGDYEVTCRGGQQSLSITVTCGGKVMLTTPKLWFFAFAGYLFPSAAEPAVVLRRPL